MISKQGAIIGDHEQILQFQAKSGANQSVTDSRKSYPHFQSSVQTSLPPPISHQYTQHSPRLLLLRKTLHFSLPWSLQTMPVFHDAVTSTLKLFPVSWAGTGLSLTVLTCVRPIASFFDNAAKLSHLVGLLRRKTLAWAEAYFSLTQSLRAAWPIIKFMAGQNVV